MVSATTQSFSRLRVTSAIRTEAMGTRLSGSRHPAVREAFEPPQLFREAPGLLPTGRDMGTVVFPDAQLKGFPDRQPA